MQMWANWQEAKPATVAIAGLGLIGGSLALRLIQRGVHVVAWNHRSAPYEQAHAAGITTVDTLEQLVDAQPDVLVLCTPLRAMQATCDRLAAVWDARITLTDVGSVKRQVRACVQAAGLELSYVGAHPMAGNEHSGFDAAYAGLFDQALWALTVTEQTAWWRVQQMIALIVGVCDNRCIITTDMAHDAAASLISHMPHAVATALANTMQKSPIRSVAQALAAGSWRDMTRVALTDPSRTQAMVEEDSDTVAQLLHQVAAQLTDIAYALESGDHTAVDDFFALAQPYRDFRMQQLRDNRPSLSVTVDLQHWFEQLTQYPQRGMQIVGLEGERTLAIEQRTAW